MGPIHMAVHDLNTGVITTYWDNNNNTVYMANTTMYSSYCMLMGIPLLAMVALSSLVCVYPVWPFPISWVFWYPFPDPYTRLLVPEKFNSLLSFWADQPVWCSTRNGQQMAPYGSPIPRGSSNVVVSTNSVVPVMAHGWHLLYLGTFCITLYLY